MLIRMQRIVTDSAWYKNAIFYEVFVRGFFDSTNDGNGDLPGLISKLDYLEWLGITCLWLLPIYASPLKDGGYDISDFYSPHPIYGTIKDVELLIDEAHKRGMKVISDLVLNHTSDQHPWFIDSRSSDSSPYSEWYIWSEDASRYSSARIIFSDTEKSNWTWDPVRKKYYFHRFFSHQPDLNYDNPEVVDEMLNVVRYWLDFGLDGYRLDAVPYLYKADHTNCENLSQTHAFLKRLRMEVDKRYVDRVLLAEANQWPTDVVDYFGDGDECHMCFHFPLMPRMFMAIRREHKYPITEILAQTPDIPDNCQWGLFLRNHDELTLEMVSDEERDFMFQEYAKDARMKRNMGITRRLAPLVDNNRPVAELLYALLFSLSGSPIIYYGDEIMMGDNIYLGDRDAVRTPMQWSSDSNGGFSKADFAQLYLPVSFDPVYGYQAVNVEASIRNQSSFLHWIKNLIAARKRYPVFGEGEFKIINSDNPSVFSFIRCAKQTLPDTDDAMSLGEDTILCVFNLSKFAQPATLELYEYKGRSVIEVAGRVRFPKISDQPYFVTLAPYGYLWLVLSEEL
jgi:maltose alpha-D-glucosyltransferase/alpha-amylase